MFNYGPIFKMSTSTGHLERDLDINNITNYLSNNMVVRNIPVMTTANCYILSTRKYCTLVMTGE